MFKVAKHDKGKACQAYGCKNLKGQGRLCHKHARRREKERDPIGYAFRVTRQNARRRGKAWGLTRAEFEEFCAESGYLEKKGRRPDSASIDRIDRRRGYSADNIKILSLSDNGRKGCSEKNCPF